MSTPAAEASRRKGTRRSASSVRRDKEEAQTAWFQYYQLAFNARLSRAGERFRQDRRSFIIRSRMTGEMTGNSEDLTRLGELWSSPSYRDFMTSLRTFHQNATDPSQPKEVSRFRNLFKWTCMVEAGSFTEEQAADAVQESTEECLKLFWGYAEARRTVPGRRFVSINRPTGAGGRKCRRASGGESKSSAIGGSRADVSGETETNASEQARLLEEHGMMSNRVGVDHGRAQAGTRIIEPQTTQMTDLEAIADGTGSDFDQTGFDAWLEAENAKLRQEAGQ